MAFPHPLDPPTQWAAAATFGKLVAQGIVEAADVLPQLLQAAVAAGYTGDLSGLQARLAWQVMDTAETWRLERARCEWEIRKAIGPLAQQRAPAVEIVDAANATNEARGGPYLPREVRGIVEQELRAWLARTQSRSRPHG